MDRPTLEVADVFRAAADKFFSAGHQWITWMHLKVVRAILRCRTPELGGHVDRCSSCGHQAISFSSCRNRHCPKCQSLARNRWLEARQRDLLPVPYAHVVFTLPHQFGPLALRNKTAIYDLLFRTSAETLLEVARDPRLLGAEIGFFSVLHSWNQKLLFHPHVHCIVPAGGLTSDHSQWVSARRRFFLPRRVLRIVFQGKFINGLRQLYRQHQLRFAGVIGPLANPQIFEALISSVFVKDWVIYCKRPFRGADQALRYLGSYTHRVAISNHRLVALAGDQVTFRWRDSAHGNQQRQLTISTEEFMRRFLLHVLPQGFVRIRYFGFFSHRCRATLVSRCFELLAAQSRRQPGQPPSIHNFWPCPRCGAMMQVVEQLSAARIRLRLRSPPFSDGAA